MMADLDKLFFDGTGHPAVRVDRWIAAMRVVCDGLEAHSRCVLVRGVGGDLGLMKDLNVQTGMVNVLHPKLDEW